MYGGETGYNDRAHGEQNPSTRDGRGIRQGNKGRSWGNIEDSNASIRSPQRRKRRHGLEREEAKSNTTDETANPNRRRALIATKKRKANISHSRGTTPQNSRSRWRRRRNRKLNMCVGSWGVCGVLVGWWWVGWVVAG